jgi:hypothetical protein
LSGEPAIASCDSWPLNHDWGRNGPENGLGQANHFSARWTGDFYFEPGDYTFIANTNDGMRVWVDGVKVIDKWFNQATHEYQVTRTMSQGVHRVKVEYYEATGNALAQLRWEPFFVDASGAGNHGACEDSAACPAVGARGRVGLAAEFDGGDDLITVPDDEALNFYDIYGAPFSVGVWVRPTQTRNGYQTLVAKSNDAGGDRNYALRIAPNSMQVQFGFDYRPMASQACMYEKEGLSQGELLHNQWNYVVMTYEGQPNNALKFYINGYLDTVIHTGPLNFICQNYDPLTLGGDSAATGAFAGRLDEITLYNRALSWSEVRDTFQYQGKWVEDRQSHAITVDADVPASELLSVRTDARDYRAAQNVALHVAAQDATSAVSLVELGVAAPGQDVAWASAPRCMDGAGDTAWCPTFVPSGEGRYTLETRAPHAGKCLDGAALRHGQRSRPAWRIRGQRRRAH